jgi:hypothetical protein
MVRVERCKAPRTPETSLNPCKYKATKSFMTELLTRIAFFLTGQKYAPPSLPGLLDPPTNTEATADGHDTGSECD